MKDFNVRVYDGCFGLVVSEWGVPLKCSRCGTVGSIAVSGVELGTWCCPGDFGGRQGRFTPEWWLTSSTQYGLMKRWKVTNDGCYLDGEKIFDVTLEQLHLTDKPYIAVRIGVKPDALHQGGINLFGEKFGDYNQAIVMRLDCTAK